MTLFELWFSQGICPVVGLSSTVFKIYLDTSSRFAWYCMVSLIIYSPRDEPLGRHHPHYHKQHFDKYPGPAPSGTCMTASLGSTSGSGTEGWFPSGCSVLTTLWSTYHGDSTRFISCKWENLRLREVK